MPIRRPIDDLPQPEQASPKLPVAQPLVITKVAEQWHRKYLSEGRGEYGAALPELPFRASSVAFRCDRQLWYSMTDSERSNPDTLADSWRFGLGQMVHEYLQSVLADLGDGWESEVKVDLRSISIPGSAHADLVHYTDGKPDIVCELKTINGFGYKMAATNFKGPAEGPKHAHILQGGMAAKALGASKLVIGYLSLENVSPNLAHQYAGSDAGRFASEWHFNVADLDEMIAVETRRINRLVAAAKLEVLPLPMLAQPDFPVGAHIEPTKQGVWRVLDPAGVVIDYGKTWLCDYCGWRDRCATDVASVTSAEF